MILASSERDHLLRVIRRLEPGTWSFGEAARILLLDVQDWCCAICGHRFLRAQDRNFLGWMWPYAYEASIDHVIPKVRGGFPGLGNIVLAHSRCNNRKGERTPTACECLWLYLVNLKLGIAT